MTRNAARARAVPDGEPKGNDQQFAQQYAQYSQIARTGSSRYAPHLVQDKHGRVFVYWYDTISIGEYDEMRMDAQIRAGLQLIKLPIQRAGWFCTCADQDVAAFVTQVLTPIWDDLIRMALTAMDFGFSVFEKIWTVAYGLRVTATQGNLDASRERIYPMAQVIKRLLHLDPKTLWLLAFNRSSDFAGVQQFTPENVLVPASKCFLYTHEKEFGELYGMSRIKPCYPYWYFTKLMYENINVFYETYSVPMKKVRHPVGQSDEGVDHSQTALGIGSALRTDHTIALPSTTFEGNGNTTSYLWDVEFLESSRSGGDQLAYIDHLNVMKLKALLVPQLALEIGGSGSYALAQEQIDLFLSGEETLAAQLVAAINEQIVDQLVLRNFGRHAPTCRVRMEPFTKTMSEGIKQALVETIGQNQPIPLADGNVMLPDWRWLSERCGIPVQILSKDELQGYLEAQDAVAPPQMDMPYGQGPPAAGGDQQPYPDSGQDDVEASERGYWQVVEGELVWIPGIAA